MILYCVWLGLAIRYSFPDEQGTDFYPIRICTEAFIDKGLPYDPSSSEKLRDTWNVVREKRMVAPVCAYPLPFYIVTLPFGLLPFGYAYALWYAVLLLIPPLFLLLGKDYRQAPWVPLLFFPLFHAVSLKTSSALWLGFCVLTLAALSRRRYVCAALLAGITSTKPQIGVFVSAYALYLLCGIRGTKKFPLLLLAFLPWLIAFVIKPGWGEEWLGAVRDYQLSAVTSPLLPIELLLPILIICAFLFYRVSIISLAGVLQFTIFPVNDLYSSLPLMLCWTCIGEPRIFLLILITSLLPFTIQEPNSLAALQVSVFLPVLVATSMEARRLSRSARSTGASRGLS